MLPVLFCFGAVLTCCSPAFSGLDRYIKPQEHTSLSSQPCSCHYCKVLWVQKNKKVSVLEEGLWLFWPLKATLGISSRFSACTKLWQRMCVKVQVWCVMMTEQAFAVSPLMEMLGMFSAMAEQYVSNLGLPQCYERGGGERIWVEKGSRRNTEKRGGGMWRDYFFAHNRSVEVENSSSDVVKERKMGVSCQGRG